MNRHDKFIKIQENYLQKLSFETREALRMYSTIIYKTINQYLEGNIITKDINLERVIKLIDIAFNNAPMLTEDMYVYRGVKLPSIKDKRRNQEKFLFNYNGLYKGFTSTSLNKYIPELFIGDDCCKFKILIPKSTRVLYLSILSDVQSEEEVLLPRNSTFSITGFKDNVTLLKYETPSKNL
jgi:hypothetical protein